MTSRENLTHSLPTLSCIDRRSFLGGAALGALTLALPRDSFLRAQGAFRRDAPRPIRVSGRVVSGRRGIRRVAVSDGFAVVDSDADGYFQLVTNSHRPFVSISLPSGYAIPRNPTGTALFYRPIAPARGDELSVSFELEPLHESDERHAALLLADIQVQDAEEVRMFLEQTVPDVKALAGELDAAVHGISCGDIMFDHLELYPDYESGVQQMGIPFFQVLGNHDMDYSSMTDEMSTVTFSRHFGPPYYSFNRGAVHYVVLDDVFWGVSNYVGYLTQDQLTWLDADLSRVEPGSPVVVSAHIPILGSRHRREGRESPNPGIAVANRDALYELLAPFNAHILTGHTHECEHVFEAGTHENVAGSASGAWWSGPICGDGTPSGYGVYEFNGEGVSWRYKSTGFPFEHQMRVYPRGSDPAAPDEIVANVWNWDPEWSVVWYEDGDRRGEMARRVGHDPLSVELHEGSEKPPRRPWVEPYRTGHLFYAPVSRDAVDIRVEATDRFGRSYSERLPA